MDRSLYLELDRLNREGNELVSRGRTEEGVARLRQALALAPGHEVLLFNLGAALLAAQRPEQALDPLRQLHARQPRKKEVVVNLALALARSGLRPAALELLQSALRLLPDEPDLHQHLGTEALRAGQLSLARRHLERCLELRPEDADAACNLGLALQGLDLREAAEQAYQRAIDRSPHHPAAWAGLADLMQAGESGAVEHRRRVLSRRPELHSIRSSLLMCLQYQEGPREELSAEHRQYGALISLALPRPPRRPRSGRLRVGFLSADLRQHAMLHMALGVFQHRPQGEVELTAYSNNPRSDAGTALFRAHSDRWREVGRLSDAQLAAQIREDGIDLLIDMSGHAPGNRLPALALRPAPVMVGWGDYVDTRGMPELDELWWDAVHIPPGEEAHYVERVVRLPHDYISWRPPAEGPPPRREPGPFTWGCFSEPTKIQPITAQRWARVLEATPGSQLLVNHSLLGRTALRRALQAMLLEAGIPEDRLRLQAGGSWTSFLDQYAQVDAILDTSPYSGGQTTLEALWMGVPVLTVPGDRIASRHSTCHLRAAGLSQWSFPSAEALVQGAALLVQQEEERRAWRVQLREQLLDSPICDRRGHARAFWQRAHDAGQGGWT